MIAVQYSRAIVLFKTNGEYAFADTDAIFFLSVCVYLVWKWEKTMPLSGDWQPPHKHTTHLRNSTKIIINKIKVNNDGKSTSQRQPKLQPEQKRAGTAGRDVEREWHRQQSSASNFSPVGKSNAIFILYHLRPFCLLSHVCSLPPHFFFLSFFSSLSTWALSTSSKYK